MRGPLDILVENGRITNMQPARQQEFSGSAMGGAPISRNADRTIDAKGMYVLPGLIDMHGHVQFSRGGKQLPKELFP